MEVFLLIVGLTLLLIILDRLKSSLNSRFDHLQKKIDDLRDEVRKSRGEPAVGEKPSKKSILADEITINNPSFP